MAADGAPTPAPFERLPPSCSQERLRERLEADGVAVLEGALGACELASVRGELERWFDAAPAGDGVLFGRRTRRFGGVFAKAPSTASLAIHPSIFGAIDAALRGPPCAPTCDVIELNLTQAIAIEPGEPAQVLHRDEALWPVSLPYEIMANVMWTLDEFTRENGATRVVPGSHHWDRARAPQLGESVSVEAPAGSAIVWVGGLLHGGGANRSHQVRRGLVISYRLGWLAPAEKLLLSVPPDDARRLPRAVQRLLGYQIHRPNLGWVEGRDPMGWLHGEYRELAPAGDNLDPEAEARMRAVMTLPEFEGYRS